MVLADYPGCCALVLGGLPAIERRALRQYDLPGFGPSIKAALSKATPTTSKTSEINFVAGHRGMVGAAICRRLAEAGVKDLLTRGHDRLDLTDQSAVRQLFFGQRPDQVYLAAAKVGGIYANNEYAAGFLYQNLMMEANVIHSAFQSGVKRLLFLGSSCIYPRLATQPMREDALRFWKEPDSGDCRCRSVLEPEV